MFARLDPAALEPQEQFKAQTEFHRGRRRRQSIGQFRFLYLCHTKTVVILLPSTPHLVH